MTDDVDDDAPLSRHNLAFKVNAASSKVSAAFAAELDGLATTRSEALVAQLRASGLTEVAGVTLEQSAGEVVCVGGGVIHFARFKLQIPTTRSS